VVQEQEDGDQNEAAAGADQSAKRAHEQAEWNKPKIVIRHGVIVITTRRRMAKNPREVPSSSG
jgi:hypothetical protein